MPSDLKDPDVARVLEGFDLRDAMLAGLAAGANDLTEAAHTLAANARMTRWERRALMTLLAVNAAVLLVVLGMAVALGVIAVGNRDSVRAIRDCTTPGGECYERGSDRTGDAVARLLQTQVIVEECGLLAVRDPRATEQTFEACVADRVARLPEN